MFALIDNYICTIYSNWSPQYLLLKKYKIVDSNIGSLSF